MKNTFVFVLALALLAALCCCACGQKIEAQTSLSPVFHQLARRAEHSLAKSASSLEKISRLLSR